MANTYTQIYIQIVFAVKYRQALIAPEWQERMHKYITGIVQNKGHKLIAVNSVPDHIHIFVGQKPHAALSDLVRDIKKDSTNFINENFHPRPRFAWQVGFGAFSYSHSHINAVVKYIQNQEMHHQRKSYGEEYLKLLRKFEVEYDERYIF